jgi:NADH-quinone oxidoreductase subunit J
MIVNLIVFFGLALVAVASALGLLLSKNAIYAALNLILNFVTISIFYVLLAAPFIALLQITVYAGAIMILFLFVIMLLGAERLSSGPVLPWQRPIAFVLGAILLVEGIYVILFRTGQATVVGAVSAGFGSPAAIGDLLFNAYLLPFEVISILLLAAMVGAIVLTKKQKQNG